MSQHATKSLKEAPTGQKLSCCCPTFSCLWGPFLSGPCLAEHAEHA